MKEILLFENAKFKDICCMAVCKIKSREYVASEEQNCLTSLIHFPHMRRKLLSLMFNMIDSQLKHDNINFI